MASKFRKSPPVCLCISLFRLFTYKLRYPKKYIGKSVRMDNGQEFTIFRHITIHPQIRSNNEMVFIVSFKFARLSHEANKIASIIPMLLITGFPGFITKMYSVNIENGYWQGMYQWKSRQHLEEYNKSFVFRVMNKRALRNTISSCEFEGQSLSKYIERRINQH